MKTSEIKFRAYDTLQGGKFEYWDAERNKFDGIFWAMIKNKSFKEPQPFSGIKDKMGKEIYEGDLIKFNCFNSICSVIKEEGCFSLYWKDAKYGRYGFLHEIQPCAMEVIGNIHENKDLL